VLKEAPPLVPDVAPESGLFLIDTSELFAALEGDGEARRKLEDVYRRLTHRVQYDFHNAGNDARVSDNPPPSYPHNSTSHNRTFI
jgi:hypothetical protein